MKNVIILRIKSAPTDFIYITQALGNLRATFKLNYVVIDTKNILSIFKYLYLVIFKYRNTSVIISRIATSPWLYVIAKTIDSLDQIIYLFDDDFETAKTSKILPERYKNKLLHIYDNEFCKLISLSTDTVVTSKYLQNKYKSKLLEPIVYLKKKSLSHHDNYSKFDIVYFGTAVHYHDLCHISEVIKRIHDEFENVFFKIIIGNKKPEELLTLNRVSFTPQLQWEKYLNFISNIQAHIFLAPLTEDPFNKAKSHIKFCEACIAGAVGIYSNRNPYSDIITNGIDGLLVDDGNNNWYRAIKSLITQPESIKSLAFEAQLHAEKVASITRAENFWLNTLHLENP